VIRWRRKEIVLVDTAGIKRRGRIEAGVDYYSLLRALQAVNRCDVALLMVDAGEFITAQDMHIAGYVLEAGKGMMMAVNKWDLVPEERKKEFRQKAERRFRFASYTPIVYISAQTGQGVNRILPQAWEIWQERQKRVTQAEVGEIVKEAVETHPPAHTGSRRLRIHRVYQDETQAATFIFEVNDPRLVHFSYHRYLDNRLRERLGFHGVPLRLIFKRARRKMDAKAEARA